MDYSRDVMTDHYMYLAKNAPKAYAFRPDAPLAPQQEALRKKYAELLRIPEVFQAPLPLSLWPAAAFILKFLLSANW